MKGMHKMGGHKDPKHADMLKMGTMGHDMPKMKSSQRMDGMTYAVNSKHMSHGNPHKMGSHNPY